MYACLIECYERFLLAAVKAAELPLQSPAEGELNCFAELEEGLGVVVVGGRGGAKAPLPMIGELFPV